MKFSDALAEELFRKNILSALDVRFGRLILRLSNSASWDLFLAAALTSRAAGAGHVCLDLEAVGGEAVEGVPDASPGLFCPESEAWVKTLVQSPMVGDGSAYTPLVLDYAGRLYLHRLWQDETALAETLRVRARQALPAVSRQELESTIAGLFPETAATDDPRQVQAAVCAVTRRLCIIAGGPGTGKTFTAAIILALMHLFERAAPPRIHLAAPTGKAAARLKASIRAAKRALSIDDAKKAMLPEDTATLHRLLGSIPGRGGFRFYEKNPLPTDLVIVDEASMIDLPLAAGLFKAVPDTAGIVLMGDSDQLASVESGYVLGDICHGRRRDTGSNRLPAAPNAVPPGVGAAHGEGSPDGNGISDCIVSLENSYRFPKTSGIYRLSRAVTQGDPEAVIRILDSGDSEDLRWVFQNRPDPWKTFLSAMLVESFGPCLKAENPEDALQAMARFRILCAVNRGPFGVSQINAFAETRFQRSGWIPAGGLGHGSGYPGKPILITRNLYELQIFNGDTGLIWSDSGKGLQALFPGVENGPRTVALPRLPEHETAYAMTIHKAQGSEFDEVLLVLPEQDSPVLTRELLYTGITRARRRVVLWGSEAVIRRTVSRRIQRRSGLKDALWGGEI